MPSYDVECSVCGFAGVEDVKLLDLAAWDLRTKCPSCGCETGEFRRVIRQAPAVQSGAKPTRFLKSCEKDEMRHRAAKHHNPDKIAAARESVAKGEFEP